MTPLASIVMPVRNGAAFVREAIASVLGQDVHDFELIVVDDGSDDNTPRILADLAAGDNRITPIRQAPQGIAAALNRAVATARAPYLARLDADDRARPDRLGRQLSFMEANKDIGLLGSAADRIDVTGAVIGRIAPPTEPARLARMLVRTNPFIHSSVMMRTALVRQLGGYRPAFKAAEDYDLWLRMEEAGATANLPDALVQYRAHQTNLSRRDAVRQSFSVRLAQRAAATRRSGAGDPADRLAAPPDWWAADASTSFYGEHAGFYRFLDADDFAAAKYLREVERRFFALNHVERKLAQEKLHVILDKTPDASRAARIAMLIALLHPGRALRLAWTWRHGASMKSY